MKLSDFSQPELLEIAEMFGTDADQSHNEQQIIARLVEDGVTQEMVNSYLQGKDEALAQIEADAEAAAELEKEEVKPTRARAKKAAAVEVPEQVLLFMERENPTYKIRGYTFTREHPFALVRSEDAEFITDHEEGFRYATPKEAREFYS